MWKPEGENDTGNEVSVSRDRSVISRKYIILKTVFSVFPRRLEILSSLALTQLIV